MAASNGTVVVSSLQQKEASSITLPLPGESHLHPVLTLSCDAERRRDAQLLHRRGDSWPCYVCFHELQGSTASGRDYAR